ncbi:hypothetical protein MSAN_00886100 [Mycena sanguinolenta]|uniref:DUF6534 domain-containing protein n=1 Tax=Mycena sanguinolenta TaxID=230812 RepID=A0A8H6YW52_9AGAR|nr:hypothetical protein MSAN_00886100 [Mycena sanguinolenta]
MVAHSAAKVSSTHRLARFFTMSTTLPRLDGITGALLIGTWASSVLYMAELLQAVYYFRNFKDNWKLKSYVAVAFAIDTISAIGDYACVYLYTITHAGDVVYLNKQNWPVPLYLISTSCVAFLVQSFLTFRYWRFTNNTIIVCFLSILILASFGGGISSALTIALFPAFKDRNRVRISGTVYLVTQGSADLTIAGMLVRELMRAKSMFKGQRRINNMLNRLVLHTIQTGTATAVLAVLALVIFLIDNESNIPVGILYASGRAYVLSMLIHLNIREYGRSKNSTISGGQGGGLVDASSATHNISSVRKYITQTVFRDTEAPIPEEFRDTGELHSSNSGSVKSSVLLSTLQSTASISETQPPRDRDGANRL